MNQGYASHPSGPNSDTSHDAQSYPLPLCVQTIIPINDPLELVHSVRPQTIDDLVTK